ncbi:MuF-C-terminal domain-containing protein [Oribacterium sp.]
MGRFSSLFDTKQQEENRKLVQGYIAERARRTEGSVARPASPISNSSPQGELQATAQKSGSFDSSPLGYRDRWLNKGQGTTKPAGFSFKLPKMNPVENNGGGYNWSEKQGAIGNVEKPVQNPTATAPVRTYNTPTTLSPEAMANLKSYQANTGTTSQNLSGGVPVDFQGLVKDAYENTREYAYLNRLSQKPIVGKLAPVVGAGQYVLSNIDSGFEGIRNTAEQIMSDDKISSQNMNGAFRSNAMREGSLRALRNNLGMKYDGVKDTGEKIANFVGGTALDAASSAANATLFGTGGLALAAGNAANQEYLETVDNPNITRDQMLLSGLAKGVAEAAWEFAPQSHFLEMSKNGLGTTGKEIAKNVLKQMGQEAIEEMGTELTNTASDYLIKGKQSDMVQEYLARRQAGESDKEAKFNTAKGIAANVAMSGLGGALSGGFSTGIAGMSNTVRNGIAYSGMNGTYQDIADSADTSTEEGKAIHEVATRLAEKEAKGQKVSLMDRGYLGNAIDNAAIEASKQAETNNSTLEAETSHDGVPVQSEEGNNTPYNVLSNNQTEDSIREEGGKAVAPELSNRIQQIDSTRKAMEQNALHEFSGNYDTEGKQAFVKNYDGSLDLPTYIKAYNDIYNIARYNYKTGHEDLRTGAVKTARMALLSEEQRKEIYKAGFRDLMATEKNWNQNFKERVEKREGGVMDAVPHAPKNLTTVLNALGKNTGLLFRITDSKYADGANGSYEKGKGIITIDLQSDNVLGTVAHEMTHWLKDYNEIAYPMFRGHVVESLVRSSGTDFDTLKEAYRNRYGQNMTEEEVVDEIVADATTRFLNDEKLVKEILADKETKGFAAKILDWIKSVIDAYKELISHTGDRRASLALQEDLKRYEEARELWSYGIEEATQNMQKYEPVNHAEDSETELSQVQLQKIIDEGTPHEQLLEHIYQTGTHNNRYVYIQETPKILSKILGIDSLPMVMNIEHVVSVQAKTKAEIQQKLNLTPQQLQDRNPHGLKASDIIIDSKAIDTPAFIIRSDDETKDCSFVVVTNKFDSKGDRVIVAVQPSDQFRYAKISIVSNRIKSVYGKEEFGTYLKTHKKDLLYIEPSERKKNYTYKDTKKNRGTAPASLSLVLPATSVVGFNLARFQMDVNKILQNVDPKARNDSNKVEPYFQNELQNFTNSQSNNTKDSTTGDTTSANEILHQLDISEEYYHTLEEENSELKKANNYLSEVLNAEKSHVPSQSDVRKTADRMLDEFKSSFKKSDLVEQLTGLYQYLKESKNIDGGEVTRVSRSIAREVIDNAQYQDEDEVREYKAFKGFFDKRPLYIPEEYIEDIYPDGFGALRKKYFGKVDIRKANADHQNNIYDIYRELQREFPNQFPEHDFTSNDADVALEILDGFEQLRPKDYEHFPGEEYNHAVDRLADEIFNAYFEVGEESLNNKYKKSYKKLKEDARASLEQEYREKYEAKLEKYIAKAEKKDEKSVARIKALRADYKDSLIDYDTFIREEARILKKTGLEYQARRELHQAYREKQDEQRHRQIYKREIVRDSKALMNMAVNPTDNLHVPKVLLKDLVPVLSSVDFSSVNTYDGKLPKISMTAGEFAKNLETLNKRLTEAEENGGVFTEEDGKGMYLDIDPDLRASLQEVQESVKGIDGNMNRLSTEQLQTLRNSLRGLKKIVESQNKFISDTLNAKVSEVANEVINEFASQKTGIDWNSKTHEFLNYNMLDAYSFFHEMGDGGKKVYKLLRAARDKKTVALNQVENRFKEAMKENHIKTKDITKLSNDTFTFTVHNVRGNVKAEATMTKAQLMSMYLYNLRDQARMHLYGERTDAETGAKHIEEKLGGFKIIGKKILGATIRDENVYKLTEAEVNALVDEHLTDNEKSFADSIGKILSIDVAKFGNEASNAVYGYDKFTEKNYFPIKVDKDTIDMKNSDLERNMSTLKNKGMTKSLQKEAYNPLIVDDIFEVMMKHVDEMTSYGAYFPAITDMQKFYNMKDETGNSVHRELSRVMGKGGTNYYMNLLRDLNGSRGDTDNADKFSQGFSSLYKGAKVLGNLRVAIQQPTAYARAIAAIEPIYLAKGLSLPITEANKEWELAKKYAPIALWKSMSGSFDINMGKGLRQQMTGEATIREDIANKAGFLLEKGDEFAWKRLWYAAEKKVEATTDLKKGTEEYYKAAADIFNDIIDKTQVVDSVLNRTDAMKGKSGLTKLTTSFMSEPSKTYNMVYRAYSDYKKGKGNAKELLGVMSAYVLNAALAAAAASVLSAMRDKDKEKKYGERWLDAFVGGFKDNINPIGYIPFAKDLAEIAMNGFSGKWNNGSNDLTTKPIADAVKAVKSLHDAMNEDSKLGVAGNLYKASNMLDIAGIPMSNTLRDIGALYDTLIYDVLDDMNLQYERDKLVYNMEGKNKKGDYINVKRFLSSALKAYTRGDKALGDKIMADLKAKLGDDVIEEAMKKQLKGNDTIQAMAEKKASGQDYSEDMQELLNQGFSEAIVDEVLGNAYKKQSPIKKEDLAEQLFEQSEGYKDSLKAYVDYKKADGVSDDKIRSSIKSAVTGRYKEAYQAAIGNPAESDAILKKILRITYEGKQLYTEKDLKQWAKK